LEFVVYTSSVHEKPYYKKSKIRQLQLEQDSGKSLHVPSGNRSLIDLNRAGIALMEIVFEPDLEDGEEAGALVRELSLILQRIGTCSCRMEEGALRVDANISVNRRGMPLGTRTELKNLSSLRSLINGIEFEVNRQIQELEEGRIVINETRSYNSETKQTVPMRDKEERQDYRFMPEPNLPPLKVVYEPGAGRRGDKVNIADLRTKMKELPEVTRQRLIKSFGVKLETAIIILNTPGFLEYFNSVMQTVDPNLGMRAANFISVEMLRILNEANRTLEECPVEPKKVGELVTLLDSGMVSFIKAVDILHLLFQGDTRSPVEIMENENWIKVSDASVIQSVCEQVISENENLVANFKKSGKQKHVNQLIAKVKTKTEGKYDMKHVSETIQKLLQGSPK